MGKPKHIGTQHHVTNRLVDPSALSINPENERIYERDSDDNKALRQSILAQGVMSPLRVYEDGTVEDGNRRLFNIQILLEEGHPIPTVPAVVVERPSDEKEAVIRRLNLNEAKQFGPLEQGKAFAKLRAVGMNDVEISKVTPFTNAHIGNMIRLFNSSADIGKAIEDGKIAASTVVEALKTYGDEYGEDIVREAIALAEGQGKRATQKHIDKVADAREGAMAEPVDADEGDTVDAEPVDNAEGDTVDAEPVDNAEGDTVDADDAEGDSADDADEGDSAELADSDDNPDEGEQVDTELADNADSDDTAEPVDEDSLSTETPTPVITGEEEVKPSAPTPASSKNAKMRMHFHDIMGEVLDLVVATDEASPEEANEQFEMFVQFARDWIQRVQQDGITLED